METTNVDRLNNAKQMDDFYCSLIDLIPPDNFGLDEEIKEQLRDYKHIAVDRKLKEYEKGRLLAGGRQLLSRLDYGLPRTVTDIWAWLAIQKPDISKNEQKQNKYRLKDNKPTRYKEENETNNVGDQENDEKSILADKQKAKRKSKCLTKTVPNERRMALLAKLQAKLSQLKTARDGDDSDKKSKQQWKNVKRNLLRLKKENSGENKKVKRKTTTPRESLTNPPPQTSKFPKKNGDDDVAEKKIIKNGRGQVVYSKFDFAVSGLKKSDKINKEKEGDNKLSLRRKRDFAGKDYKKLLDKVENNERRLVELKETNPEKAAHIENNQKWNKALENVQGIKIKDDKKLLKNNMKRKEKQKQKTLQDWSQRDENVKAKISKKQNKRQEHLKERSDENKRRKIEKAKKKGRIVIP